jgi:prophage antirepressor-like protein
MEKSVIPQLFNYGEQEVRVLIEGGEPWFSAEDVCRILGLRNPTMAVGRLDNDEKGLRTMDTPGGRQSMWTVNEYGLYSLVLGSRKSEAKTFKRWITHEVIPSIRTTGFYSTGLTPTEALLHSVELLAKQERELNVVKQAQLKSQAALMEHEFALTTLDQRVTHEITLTTREQKQIQGAVNSRAHTIGLPDLYRQIYGTLKKQFGIPSYRDLKRSDLTKAFEFIRCWSPGIQ